MAKDHNINIIKREQIDNLENFLNSEIETKIELPKQNIEKWIKQFNK